MRRKRIIPFIVAAALVLGTLAGVVTYQNVFAQAVTPTPNAPAQVPQGKGVRGGFEGGYTQQDLAAALGVDLSQLQTAEQTAFKNALSEAVSKGLITQAQADQLAARGNFGRGFFGEKMFANNGIDYNALLAQALNISTDQLTAAYQKAFNTALDNAVANGNLTQAQADLIRGRQALANDPTFTNSLQSAFTAAVNQAVKDGVITQAQADAILAQRQNQKAPGFFGGFRPFGGFGGHHGFGRGGWEQNGGNNSNNTTPNNPPSNSNGF